MLLRVLPLREGTRAADHAPELTGNVGRCLKQTKKQKKTLVFNSLGANLANPKRPESFRSTECSGRIWGHMSPIYGSAVLYFHVRSRSEPGDWTHAFCEAIEFTPRPVAIEVKSRGPITLSSALPRVWTAAWSNRPSAAVVHQQHYSGVWCGVHDIHLPGKYVIRRSQHLRYLEDRNTRNVNQTNEWCIQIRPGENTNSPNTKQGQGWTLAALQCLQHIPGSITVLIELLDCTAVLYSSYICHAVQRTLLHRLVHSINSSFSVSYK